MNVPEIAYKYLVDNGYDSIAFGDTRNLDSIAKLCTHTNLMELHPLNRHYRLLNYLEHSKLFEKKYYRFNRLCRIFYIKP